MRAHIKPCWTVAVLFLGAAVCGAQVVESNPGEASVGLAQSLHQKAEAGDSGAQYELGLYAKQRGDYQEAFNWFQLAAKQGLNGAQVDLAYLYVTGFGTAKDLEQAVHWYGLAAAQGNPNGEYSLGICYLHGEGIAQNSELARKWISLAFRHGDGARSLNATGLTYEIGPDRDLGEALKWYEKAAEMGYSEAQFNVCRLTAQGLVSPADYKASTDWCSTLAERGDPWGEYGLARMFVAGVGMQPDLKKAAEWYKKSAEQGNPAAQFELAALYSQGKGVQKNLPEAYKWATIAGAKKHPEARDFMESLTAQMTKTQISSAQSLALKWTQEHPLDPESSQTLDHIVYDMP
ncbi:MAG TPA: tetratricopeptide repeat protein [Candidatus Binatus sp.]|nr:tetratricopeptide repeat protein [Candidatus Binatus sp.]